MTVPRLAPVRLLGGLGGMAGLAVLLALTTGATGIGPAMLMRLIASGWSATPRPELAAAHLVILDIRLPRALLATATGAALGLSGAVMQGLLRNPLADPALIGVSAGAGLVAAIVIMAGNALTATPVGAILHGLGGLALPVAGLIGGLGATALLYALATRRGTTAIATVLLGGVALNAFAGALTGLLIFGADDRTLRDFTFWTLGSLAGASWTKLGLLTPFLASAAVAALWLATPLNLLLLGEAEAFHMGVRVQATKRLAVCVVAALVGACVAMVGAIGFIGLLVPHVVRLLGGPNHWLVLPGSALLGAALLLVADSLARTLAQPAEIPVGIVTAAIGAPCFCWLLLRHQAAR